MGSNIRLADFMFRHGFIAKEYASFFQRSISDIGWFWDSATEYLGIEWQSKYSKIISPSDREKAPWDSRFYIDGLLNITESCLEKHALDLQRIAMICEDESGNSSSYTYAELMHRVNRAAVGLKSLGLKRGDRVIIYLPMIAENIIAILAVARLGAIFVPCFSGYGSGAISKRASDCQAKFIITVDYARRRGKLVNMKQEVDLASEDLESLEHVIVVKREENQEPPWNRDRDIDWSDLMQSGSSDKIETEVMASSDLLMLLYTSGTTGNPKGTLHTHAGFPIKAAVDAALGMNLDRGDRLCWITDMGWMMGPWMLFGTLINGATMLLFDGSPDYPTPDRLWQLVAKHKLTHLGISPTLIRLLIKQGDSWIEKHDLSSLQSFGSTGEPWNEQPWHWLYDIVGKGQVPIFNYSGGTEISGGILGNILLRESKPCGFNSPLPGMDADVLKSDPGDEVGQLVLRQPWVGMTPGFWNDKEGTRYKESYWPEGSDLWIHGDWAQIDSEKHWKITGRSDDTLKIGGKRLGPSEIESILVGHDLVTEAAVIGVPDSVKGEALVCFVVALDILDIDSFVQGLETLVVASMGKALKPQKIYLVSELPKTRNGKILRRLIKSAYLNQTLGDLSSLDNLGILTEIANLESGEIK